MFFLMVKDVEFLGASSDVLGLIRSIASPSKATKHQKDVLGPRNRAFL